MEPAPTPAMATCAIVNPVLLDQNAKSTLMSAQVGRARTTEIALTSSMATNVTASLPLREQIARQV